MIFGTLSFRGCGGQPLALVWNIRVKSQMPIAPEHAFKEKSTKSLILLPLRTIYNRTFQCETPCSNIVSSKGRWTRFKYSKLKFLTVVPSMVTEAFALLDMTSTVRNFGMFSWSFNWLERWWFWGRVWEFNSFSLPLPLPPTLGPDQSYAAWKVKKSYY